VSGTYDGLEKKLGLLCELELEMFDLMLICGAISPLVGGSSFWISVPSDKMDIGDYFLGSSESIEITILG